MGNAPSAAPDATGALSHEIIGTRIVAEKGAWQSLTISDCHGFRAKLKHWRASQALFAPEGAPVLEF
jgi:hypothetical protein